MGLHHVDTRNELGRFAGLYPGHHLGHVLHVALPPLGRIARFLVLHHVFERHPDDLGSGGVDVLVVVLHVQCQVLVEPDSLKYHLIYRGDENMCL